MIELNSFFSFDTELQKSYNIMQYNLRKKGKLIRPPKRFGNFLS